MKTTSKKLLGYSAVAAAFLITGNEVDAGIVYTDLGAGYLVDDFDAYDIDFDGDGAVDASIFQRGDFYYSYYVTYYGYSTFFYGFGYAYIGLDVGANNFAASGFGGYPYPFSSGIGVGATATAIPASSGSGRLFYSYIYGFTSGPWFFGTDAYLALNFTSGSGTTHNAWVRLEVFSGFSARVLGYAYETIPDATIVTGNTSSPGCDPSVAPLDFLAFVSPSTVTFNWFPSTTGTVGCQLAAGPVGAGFPITRNFLGADLNTTGPIPISSIPAGTYEAKIRCACEITPVPVLTPFSNPTTFTVPAPRLEAASTELGPNPATNQLGLVYEAQSEEQVHFRIINLYGQEIFAQDATMFAGKQNVTFDLSEFHSGTYFLQIVNGKQTLTEQFEVIK